MQPPIGVDNFRTLIETRDNQGRPYLFVDKSLFIKDLLDDLSIVKLITRPRRFGKTLNMSMLHHFLANEVNNIPTKELFKHLKIAKYNEYLERYQGKYPVVFMTFKDIIKEDNYEAAYQRFCKVISKVYMNHEYLLSSQKLGSYQKEVFESILRQQASLANIQDSLSDLTHALYLHHNVKPWVLIDEYDTPIQTAYTGGYYREAIDFMRGFLGAGLKGNSYLEKAVLTGILRVSKESIFSGLNNVITYSVLHPSYGEYFGFTESEVSELLEQTGFKQNINEVRAWYNGYQVGNNIIYNPWSIINYIKEGGKLSAYWVNVSGNTLIRELLIKSSTNFKAQFESLLQDKPIEIPIDEQITFNDLESNDSAIWSLLLMSGYLKATVVEEGRQGTLCQIQIPNYEVKDLYRTIIAQWLSGTNNVTVFNRFIENLLLGEVEDFAAQLKNIMLHSLSVYDIKGKEPEKFFHGFMFGLLAGIDSTQYQIHSNKESGYGRFDIAIIPKDPNKLGIIIEVKSTDSPDPKSLEEAAKEAFEQIDQKRYTTIFSQNQVKKCLKIGVAFSGKDLAVEHRIESLT